MCELCTCILTIWSQLWIPSFITITLKYFSIVCERDWTIHVKSHIHRVNKQLHGNRSHGMLICTQHQPNRHHSDIPEHVTIPPAHVTYNSCNMSTRHLPNMYTQSPRAACPRAEGIHIRQIISTHVKINMYHFQYSYNCPTLVLAALPIYVVMGSHCEYGIYFDVYLYTIYIVLVLIVGLELNLCNTFSKTSAQ